MLMLSDKLTNKGIEYSSNCITGNDDYFINALDNSFEKAVRIDIIVAFIMESGVKILKNDLSKALDRNIPIRILTGNYLNITQPQALYMLKYIMNDKVDLRFYNVSDKSFHPKSYIFQYKNGGDIFIGSSNISKSALTSGIEWNYRIQKSKNENDFEYFENTFEDLFFNHSIIVDENELNKYSKNWIRPKLYYIKENNETKSVISNIFEPRGAQIEALYELDKSRKEGFKKGLVVAATGIGKTYLAAFDSKKYKNVLFIAHREEIIKQAAQSFKNVRHDKSIGFFHSAVKDTKSDFIFATVQTLGKKEYLNDKYFSKNRFDYIVIDEFHHAVSKEYKNIINYFRPEFMLGLTATPERLDNKDVFALCDYNVVYKTRLYEAINKGWLVPFRYYGIYDDSVNFNSINLKNGKYDDIELEKALMINKRADLILKHYNSFNTKRALGFCSSKNHAEYMAEYFNKNGIKSVSVVSNGKSIYSMDRSDAINKLKKDEINVIFSVDMFNEGIDIPSIDMVMFLRPTQSSTIFLQQLGRGLRRYKNKNYLNVLDFIGNYKRANMIPFLLTRNMLKSKKAGRLSVLPDSSEYPEGCIVNMDFRLIDIFKKLSFESKKIEDKISDEYYRIKDDIKHRPSILEFFTYIDETIYTNIRNKKNLNPFNDYLGFLQKLGETNESEKNILNTAAHKFIIKISETPMSQMYKMPLLLAFYNDDRMKLKISENDIYINFKNFYKNSSNAIDLLRNKSTKDYKSFNKKDYLKLAKNPEDAFLNSAPEFFYKDSEYYCLTDKLKNFTKNKTFLSYFKDIINYRIRKFYKERLEKRYENLQ